MSYQNRERIRNDEIFANNSNLIHVSQIQIIWMFCLGKIIPSTTPFGGILAIWHLYNYTAISQSVKRRQFTTFGLVNGLKKYIIRFITSTKYRYAYTFYTEQNRTLALENELVKVGGNLLPSIASFIKLNHF